MTEGTDMNQIEKVARVGMALCQNALGGKQCPCAESGMFKCADEYPGQQAKAAIAAMQPAPQEPVGSPAEITRLTEALRAAEEREKALLSALEEWMFRYFWRADGMPVEAARIHAQSRMKIAALVGAKP